MMYSGEPRVIPTLLLDGQQLVKTRRFADPVYVGDAINVLSIFNDFEVDEIMLLDISGAHSRTPTAMAELRRYAEECFIPLSYGGGITTVDQIAELFGVGYEKVVVNSLLQDDPGTVTNAANRFGKQAIVAGIDVRRDADGHLSVFTRGGTHAVGSDPTSWAQRAVELGAGEIFLTSIDREGCYEGYDLDLVARVSAAVDVPVVAHGGASSRKNLADPVHLANAAAVAAGSLFVFQGDGRGVLVNYPSRKQIQRLLTPPSLASSPG